MAERQRLLAGIHHPNLHHQLSHPYGSKLSKQAVGHAKHPPHNRHASNAAKPPFPHQAPPSANAGTKASGKKPPGSANNTASGAGAGPASMPASAAVLAASRELAAVTFVDGLRPLICGPKVATKPTNSRAKSKAVSSLPPSASASASASASKATSKPSRPRLPPPSLGGDGSPPDLGAGNYGLFKKASKKTPKKLSSSIFQHHDKILEDPNEIEFPADIKIRRWPAKTTLIVCPRSLLGQWKHEIQTRAPSLTWAEWGNRPEHADADYAIGPNAKDVLLATYDMVRHYGEISKISWKRLILDEAQLTRRSSAQIAMDVFNLRSEYRFLMTGTPLVNCIGDLKGQLSILKIWPFTLESDGFWEQYVLRRGQSSERMLNGLPEVTMIRHSKGQNLNLVRLLLALCLSPYLLDAVSLDICRRFTWSRLATAATSSLGIQKMNPQEAIQFVAESGNGILVDSQRVFAVRGRDSRTSGCSRCGRCLSS